MKEEIKKEVVSVEMNLIDEPKEAMRTSISDEKITDLADSIKSIGLINPIIVRALNNRYEVVAGHCRLLACRKLGWTKMPCFIRTMTDDEVFAFKAAENLVREDVNPVDVAIFIGQFVGNDNTKIPLVAELLKRSQKWVEERLAILSYPDYFLPAIATNQISLGVAKALAKIEDEVYRKMYFDNAIRDGMKVWYAEYVFEQWKAGLLADSDTIIPPLEQSENNEPALLSAKCIKCGEIATTPNLATAWKHRECPVTGSD